MPTLVLLRHGQSQWNLENRFTGWWDVDLSPAGVEEARHAGSLLRDKGFDFDCCFTSVLTRAIRTLHLVLHEMDRLWLPVSKDWRLNERHYGALTGLNKQELIDEVGAEQVKIWRRSYDIPPPPLEPGSRYDVSGDRRYAGIACRAPRASRTPLRGPFPITKRKSRRRSRPAGGCLSPPTAIRCAELSNICRTSAIRISSGWKSRPASRSSTILPTTYRLFADTILDEPPRPRLSAGTSPRRRVP